MAQSALDGVKVVEFADMVSGPYCGKLLADLGAEVIKIETPEGDPSRTCGPFRDSGSDPEQSALFLYLNTSKKGVTLSLESPDDRSRFDQLIKWADILIDNHSPGFLDNYGLDEKALLELNPGLIYTSITPYGLTGPRAHTPGDELTLIHAGSLANILPARAIDIDRAPVKLGGYMVGYHGGLFAALTSLSALMGRDNDGLGRVIDISLQEVIINLVGPGITGTRYHDTTWNRVPDRPPAMGRMETSDGYVVLGATDDHHFRSFREMIGKPEWAASDDWDDRQFRAHHLMDIAPQMEDWMRLQKKDEIHHQAAQRGIPIGPMNNAQDVMNSAQYKARNYFVEVEHPKAGKHRYAGWPYQMAATPPRIARPAPLLGQHNNEVFEALKADEKKSPAPADAGDRALPLDGVRVLDFTWVWAGPYACMVLAKLGAEVIKIEGHKRSDLVRRSVPWPLSEPEPILCPPNQGMSFNSVNMNKKSLTLDLSKPEGPVSYTHLTLPTN